MNCCGLAVGLFISFFQLCPSYAMEGSPTVVTYYIEQNLEDRNILTVHLTPVPLQGGSVILGGASFIQPQVENLTCDGKPIKEEPEGCWSIPEGTLDLHWQVRLKNAKEADVGAQQSIKYDAAILLSVGSSLPRFKNTNGLEVLKISMPTIQTVYPTPDYTQTIPLPDPSNPPLFVLLNFTNGGSKTDGLITLTYFLDDQESESLVPDIEANIKGLKWLQEITGVKGPESFAVGWCKSYAERLGISGAAGSGILLAHYLLNKQTSCDKALMLYVALHEAFHQFQVRYPDEPVWVQESLASYYGARALEVAMPEEATVVMKRFKEVAHQFPKGLLTSHSEVKGGNRADYGSFYTKGVVFWEAVNGVLHSQQDNLDNHLTDVLSHTKYDEDGFPLNLHTILGLSEETWASLCRQFLLFGDDISYRAGGPTRNQAS